MSTKTYNPADVVVSVGAVIVKSNTVTADRTEDASIATAGTHGEATLTISNNDLGEITIVLPQTSEDNLSLSGLGTAIQAVVVRDLNGNSLHSIPQAMLKKIPTAEFGNETGEREWIYQGSMPIHVVGGNS